MFWLYLISFIAIQTESDGPLCGIRAAVAAAQTALNRDLAMADAVDPSYLGEHGSSAEQLQSLVENLGANASIYRGLKFSELQGLGGTRIVHIARGGPDSPFNHWGIFLDVDDNGDVRIAEPPGKPQSIPALRFEAIWDGIAISVKPTNSHNFFGKALLLFPLIVTPFVIACTVVAAMRKSCGRHFSSPAVQVLTCGLCIFCLVGWRNFGAADSLLDRKGFEVAKDLVAVGVNINFREISDAEFQQLVLESKILLIDSRFGFDFSRGTIGNAISLPIDMSEVDLVATLSKTSRDRECVVFCQSDQCTFSDAIAKRLKGLGFSSISIFRGGYRQWKML